MGELAGLVNRWKGASRIAAEELFGLVKGRVETMGSWKGLGGGWEEDRDDDRKGGRGEDADEDEGEGEGEGEEGRAEEKEVDEEEVSRCLSRKMPRTDALFRSLRCL